jgi:hypothetical protein
MGAIASNTLFPHKGFIGSWRYSEEDNRFYGRVLHIEHLYEYPGFQGVVYSAPTKLLLQQMFQQAVDNFLVSYPDARPQPHTFKSA